MTDRMIIVLQQNSIFYIFSFLTIYTFSPAQNLILNGSLEEWERDSCMHVQVYAPSVDFFKGKNRILPYRLYNSPDFNTPKYRSDGSSYLGLSAMFDEAEAVQFELSRKLVAGKKYVLQFDIYKDVKMDTARYFPYRLCDKALVPIKVEHGYKSDNHDQIPIGPCKEHTWTTIRDTIIAEGTESHLLLIAPNSHGSKFNYYFVDRVMLFSRDELSMDVFYEQGRSEIVSKKLAELRTWLELMGLHNIVSINLQGYADRKGDHVSNLKLSSERIESVKKVLDSYSKTWSIEENAYGERESSQEENDPSFRKVTIDLTLGARDTYKNTISDAVIEEIKAAMISDQAIRAPETESDYTTEQAQAIDDKNGKLLDQILSKYGYLGVTALGSEMQDDLAWMLLHQNLEMKLKYLSLIEEAVSRNECSPSMFAYLYDKIKVAQKQPQLFGTQLYFSEEENAFKLFPITLSEKVDERRREYGLGTVKDYVDSFNSGK